MIKVTHLNPLGFSHIKKRPTACSRHPFFKQIYLGKKNSRFIFLTVIILKAKQRINSVSFGGKLSKVYEYINYIITEKNHLYKSGVSLRTLSRFIDSMQHK